MLEPHPPHEAVHTWRDFFIHIATIVVGLLIAVGLEQTVEAIHHRHQRHALLEQMREEGLHNIPFERDSMSRMQSQIDYLHALRAALVAGVISGATVQVHGVSPYGGSVFHVSPSRSVWAATQSGGVAAILPAAQAQLYSRRDLNAQWEEEAESAMYEKLRELTGQCDRAAFAYRSPSVSVLTLQQRGDLLLAIDQMVMKIEELIIRVAIELGADEAVSANVTTLEGLYPYQGREVGRLPLQSYLIGSFFGSSIMDYNPGDHK